MRMEQIREKRAIVRREIEAGKELAGSSLSPFLTLKIIVILMNDHSHDHDHDHNTASFEFSQLGLRSILRYDNHNHNLKHYFQRSP